METDVGKQGWVKKTSACAFIFLPLLSSGLIYWLVAMLSVESPARGGPSYVGSQLKSLATALEAYKAELGHDPKHSSHLAGADVPQLLFAALNNKATSSLGGGPNTPYYDADSSMVGLLTGKEALAFEEQSSRNAEDLSSAAKFGSKAFQEQFRYDDLQPTVTLEGAAKLPVYLDPWGNAYHYREWQSLSEEAKKGAQKDPIPRPHNWETYDLWSNGPDGINQYGAPGSDDVTNWTASK